LEAASTSHTRSDSANNRKAVLKTQTLLIMKTTTVIWLQLLLHGSTALAAGPVCSSSMYSSLLALTDYPNVMSFCTRDFPIAAATDVTTTANVTAGTSTVIVTTTAATINQTVVRCHPAVKVQA